MSLEIRREFNAEERRWDMVLTGEVDISNAAQLRGELNKMLEEKAAPATIDIKDLSFINIEESFNESFQSFSSFGVCFVHLCDSYIC